MLLKSKYISYEDALNKLGLQTLKTRREQLALKFGQKCLDIDEMKNLFTKKADGFYDLRKNEEFSVKFAHKQRLFKSAVPSIQRLMNSNVQ